MSNLYKSDQQKSAEEVVQIARNAFNNGLTKSIAFREQQLRALLRMYQENEAAIIEALAVDLHKCKEEVILCELISLINDVIDAIDNLKNWTKPEKPKKNLFTMLDKVTVFKEPYGVVLVIGAWNYPFLVTLLPITGAIAAGNCVVIKPSEISSASTKLMAEMIPKYLNNECYHIYHGGPDETTKLLEERFDYIFYTGSTSIGKIVHAAATKYLTPTTLELGGKNPTYLDDSADIEVAARRIVWGKCVNAGQTCVAIDYLLCSKKTQEIFLEVVPKIIREFYGTNQKDSGDFGRIVSERHYKRIISMLDDAKIGFGGERDQKERFIQFTVVVDVEENHQIMQQEIFGPVLPIINVESAQDAITFINKREKPLALYVFSNDQKITDLVVQNTSSGGVCINDTMIHTAVENMPFGGVGNSGMGAYHGKYTFDTFSHNKSCLQRNLGSFGELLGSMRYPPFTNFKFNFMLMVIKKHKNLPSAIFCGLAVFVGFCSNFFYRKLVNVINNKPNISDAVMQH